MDWFDKVVIIFGSMLFVGLAIGIGCTEKQRAERKVEFTTLCENKEGKVFCDSGISGCRAYYCFKKDVFIAVGEQL